MLLLLHAIFKFSGWPTYAFTLPYYFIKFSERQILNVLIAYFKVWDCLICSFSYNPLWSATCDYCASPR